MHSRLNELTQQVDLICKILEEKPLLPLSVEALLYSKLLAYKAYLQNPNIDDHNVDRYLLSIELVLRSMTMLSKNRSEFIVSINTQAVEHSRARFFPSGGFDRFSGEEASEAPSTSLSQECQKLKKMIQFYCVPRVRKKGISLSLGASYNNLFTTPLPIYFLPFATQEDANLFIKNILSSGNENIQTCFAGLSDDLIQNKKNDEICFYLPVSTPQKKLLEENQFLSSSSGHKVIFKSKQETEKCILRLKRSRNKDVNSMNLTLEKFDQGYGFIIDEQQYTTLCQWAPWASLFFSSASPEALAEDLQARAELDSTPSITPHLLYKVMSINCNILQEEITKEKPETLFFELTKEGFLVYGSHKSNLEKLKTQLALFGFKRLEIITKADAPEVLGFDQHTKYLIIPHTQVAKLLALRFQTDKPQEKLNNLYGAKKLDPKKCRYLDKQAQVFEEIDVDFYKEYFDKILAIKASSTNDETVFSLLKDFSEDVTYDASDHRRYVIALFELQMRFDELGDDKIELPQDLHRLLYGLKTVLIIPENDDRVGISTRLSRHFHQLYQIEDMDALAPFVLFEETGCNFYFSSRLSLEMVADQFKLRGMDVEIIEDEHLSRHAEHKVPQQYTHKLIVPPHCNHELLRLSRFHPANIDTSLKQAYANQGLNFTSILLLSSSVCNIEKSKKINPSYSVASLASGEQILQLRMEAISTNTDDSMGHVLILLDDSGSMGGKKMHSANEACVNLIEKLPKNTKITLIPFYAQPLFNSCLKSELPRGWRERIRSVRADGRTPLVQTIVKAAASLSTRCFTPMDVLKEATFILLTDGHGDSRETAEEILQAVQTGSFRGEDVSKCNHALGTNELPNHAHFPIIAIGIGNDYATSVIDGLSDFAGNYHIRSDENMDSDLAEMTDSVTQTFGTKIVNVYACLVDKQTNTVIITTEIDMMLPATSRYAYVRLPKDRKLDELQAIMCVESELGSISLTKIDNQEMLVDYFRAQLDALFHQFAAKAAMKSDNHFSTSSCTTSFSTSPMTSTPSLFRLAKTNKFADIQENLRTLKLEMEDNRINSPVLLNKIEKFEALIKQAENNKLDMNEFRKQQAENSRSLCGLGSQVDKEMRISYKH